MAKENENCLTKNKILIAQSSDIVRCNSNKSFVEFENILTAFEESIFKKDLNIIKQLLLESGEFDIQNELFETITVGKELFLVWFTSLLSKVEIKSIERDQCLFCKIGNPVLLINNGFFPREIKSHSENAYTGLMLQFENDKISGITFCFTFLNKENQSMFQHNIKIIQELEKQGMSKKDAFFKVLGIEYIEDMF